MPQLTIGALAARTQCTVPTIRYYEQIGLLPPAQRASNGHRYFRDSDLRRLVFIKRCRDFGFPIEQVRTLVSLFEDEARPCSEVRDLAQEQLEAVRTRLEEMRKLESSLAAFVIDCDKACNGGTTRDCVIVGELAPEPRSAPPRSAACCGASRDNPPSAATGHGPKRV